MSSPDLCPQEQVLKHPSVGGLLAYNRWNSRMERITSGVPMLCLPFFSDQLTNCRYACTEWGIGMKIHRDVKREEVEKLVRELMEGKKGKWMKNKTMEWKEKSREATKPGGLGNW
ncbi:hypothetical protein RHMOL_Rhmol11G0197400 [Rhododendron molle]|uniref:Uncharacterized protein n=1 Tax=Rhododendron molle TaxID=49168 RepID=A0ACC0LVD3_RHOML|nr:hypothetical protein RHMOL_Rhmol11G0197400 [Rhododendron molle]